MPAVFHESNGKFGRISLVRTILDSPSGRVLSVLGLTLVALARLALGPNTSALAMMSSLADIRATLVRTTTGGPGRRRTVMLAPELAAEQRKAVKTFDLARWFPALLSCMDTRTAAA